MILANICSRGLLIISGSCAVGNANNTHKTHETFQCCSLKNISSLWALFHYLYVVSSNSTEFASYLYGLTLNSFRIYHHIVDDHKQGKGTRFDKHNHWDLTSILFITCQWSFFVVGVVIFFYYFHSINSPFYSCMLGCQALYQEWGEGWPCYDTNLAAIKCKLPCCYAN